MRQAGFFLSMTIWVCLSSAVCGAERADAFVRKWSGTADRVWVGPEFWANRLQDWQVKDGRLESVPSRLGKGMLTVHLLTQRLSAQDGDFVMEVRMGLLSDDEKTSAAASAGFLFGIAPTVDYRAAAMVQCSAGKGAGLYAGIDSTGAVFLKDFEKPFGKEHTVSPDLIRSSQSCGIPRDVLVRLTKSGRSLKIEASDTAGRNLASVEYTGIAVNRLVGGIAIVSHPGTQQPAYAWFNYLSVRGDKIESHPGRVCGPILCTQYTTHRNILKMTAQMMPIGEKENQTVRLDIQKDGKWQTAATTQIITPGFTAPFRIEKWDMTRDIPYRVVYENDGQNCVWTGTVRHNPVEKETIVVAGFTGNHNLAHPGADKGSYVWDESTLWFPHNDVACHVSKHKPDLLFFSGDQVYENNSPTTPDKSGRKNSYYDYLYKWYLYCWAYRDLLKDIPCVCIPDDHDVYQGNLWGQGGRATDKDDKGGYEMPAEWVRMVERTQTSHLPDPFDPTPVEQGIGVYYTDLNIGGVSFAVLEDRKFKSGCNGLCPATKSGRADLVIDPNFDVKTADVPGAQLLGCRQEAFLRHWAADWDDSCFKCALSQTVFAGVATHHGPGLSYLVADYDSNGWPQSGRNRALAEIRKGFGLMIAGDQHLATIVHHGIDGWDDAGWSFCVPSVANFYPRKWDPPKEPAEKVGAPQQYTGKYLDGLGNYVTVWAHTNPRPMGQEPAELHDKMPGYGIVKFNKKDRTITMECWPRFADPADPSAKQYQGWPKTIQQADNYARTAWGYLPTIQTNIDTPVVQVIEQGSGETVYTLRIQGRDFTPKVFGPGRYIVKVGLSSEKMKILRDLEARQKAGWKKIEIQL